VPPPTAPAPGWSTHEVLNQPPPLAGYDVYRSDRALVEAVHREGAGWADAEIAALGTLAGKAEVMAWGHEANAHPPVLRTHDRYGHRIDEVEYHPSYHRLMETAVSHGLHAGPWAHPRPGAHLARAAKFAVWSQVEAGHGCPVSMTYSAIPALRSEPEVAAAWEPGLTSLVYDPALRPPGDKAGLLCGMAMTEKQGGSDLRANTTQAQPLAGGGRAQEYRLVGHKWFCSAPMCDAFLVLAQAPGGLSCFLLPRVLPDGSRNGIALQRIKDKLGNRSNASCEIELHGALARLVGEEGRGVPTIIEMVNYTRLDCVVGTVAGLRQAVVQAIHHADHRRAFGRLLVDQPLMAAVLADLAVESEAATVLMARLARSYDGAAAGDAQEASLGRLATAVAKYWVCKRQPTVVAEALECLGGNGYIEESGMPRLFRESPLNGIWEGSGNVICLDVLRAISREPETLDAFLAEVHLGSGADRCLDAAIASLERELPGAAGRVGMARRLVEAMALCLQGSLLVRHAPDPVAGAFCATRLAGDWGRALGTLPPGTDTRAIVDRARPARSGP